MKRVDYNQDYLWTLKEGYPPQGKGKVFSCFAGGGGSSMGYKRAGFEVVGCLEIDPRQMGVYIANHHPKHAYTEAIQDFKYRADLPIVKASSFPLDLDFCGQRPQYVCGMSVPQLMMQRVATEVYNQWLSKL